MAVKIDVRRIIRAHFATLVDGSDPRRRTLFSDWFVFLILPLIVSGVLVKLGAFMSDSLLSTIVSALSIFVGLLLNVVVLLFDIVRTTSRPGLKKKLVKQTLANVAFSIILSLFTIPFALSTQITRWPWLKVYTSLVTYFLLCVFVATLLMITKRVYNLFLEEANATGEMVSDAVEEENPSQL